MHNFKEYNEFNIILLKLRNFPTSDKRTQSQFVVEHSQLKPSRQKDLFKTYLECVFFLLSVTCQNLDYFH